MITPSDEEIKKANELISKITEGVKGGFAGAVKNAKMHNTKIISWHDGKIVRIDPNTIDLDK